MYFSFLSFVLIDQITKAVFANRDFFFLGIHFHPVKNFALPFGLDFGGVNFVFLLITYFAVGLLVYKVGHTSRTIYIGKMMFLAGATSNLADRIIYGYVRDFIDVNLGFVFNLADVFIVVGLLLMLFFSKSVGKVDKLLATSKT